MEITMYEDGSYSNFTSRENLAQMKRKFTLDLDGRSTKKIRSLAQPSFNPLLTSPDLNMLKLGSPELDQLVMQQGSMLSNGFSFPTPTTKTATPITVSREEFVKGFQDTLEQFHHKESEIVVTSVTAENSVPVSSSLPQYTQLQVPLPQARSQVPVTTTSAFGDEPSMVYIKEEPQTVPNLCGSPPVSPIDMENQEKIKLERKRLRNRIAASKCRKRKLERIGKLEDKVTNLKNENTELQAVVKRMKNQVCSLKQEVMEHVQSGCQLPFVTQQ